MKILRGITWDHPRGFNPMPATAEAFCRDHPDLQIIWDKRSLHEFGAAPVDDLAAKYDLVVLDHPWVGFMSEAGCYRALDDLLPRSTLDRLASQSAGPSHRSYEWEGRQWALAIDAATPTASYRRDLLERLGVAVPATWAEVIGVGRAAIAAGMRIAMPLGAVDAISVFLTLADNIGAQPFRESARVVSREAGRYILDAMQSVASLCPADTFDLTPITMMDRMCTTDELVYCPLAYGYSNYSRTGFRPKLSLYADMPGLASSTPKGSHIGGTGLAISAKCGYPEIAASYAAFVASDEIQRTIYFDSGGQPGNACAWEDPRVNEISHDFFANTRKTIESAFLRPRYNGYIPFQYTGGQLIRQCLIERGEVDEMLQHLDALYERSQRGRG